MTSEDDQTGPTDGGDISGHANRPREPAGVRHNSTYARARGISPVASTTCRRRGHCPSRCTVAPRSSVTPATGCMPVATDGTVPFARWVTRRKGQVELGSMGCNTCHTRVLHDGTVVPGAQGNNPGDRQGALL